jgi:glucose/arabinose dehydrogenase
MTLSLCTHQANADVVLREFAPGFASPVDIANAGDENLFVVEKAGTIRRLTGGAQSSSLFLNITGRVLDNSSERGLLGLAFHPNYASNRRFYVYYTRETDGAIVVSRFLADATNPAIADAASEQIVIVIPHPGRDNHNGGGLRFGADGYLYIATGDGGGGGDPDCNSQNPTSLLGKILRLNVDTLAPPLNYSIPANNPTWSAVGARAEIFAIGARNPWRISFDRVNGDLYIGDVGQGSREEVTRIAAYNPTTPRTNPFNLGWPQREGSIAHSSSCGNGSGIATTEPITDYTSTDDNCAITGGYRYRGNRVPELASGVQYLFADYCTGRLWSATEPTSGSWPFALLSDTPYFVSSFGEDYRGELYVANLSGGAIYRIASTTAGNLDIDGNNSVGAGTDGVLLLRYLLGYRGPALVDNALGSGATRDANAITTYLNTHASGASPTLKIAGGSTMAATTDGLVILRYLLGLGGTALTAGVPLSAPFDTPGKVAAQLSLLEP